MRRWPTQALFWFEWGSVTAGPSYPAALPALARSSRIQSPVSLREPPGFQDQRG